MMQSPAHPPRRSRSDGLSVNIVPEQALNVELRPPHLHILFDETTEAGCCSRSMKCSKLEDEDDDPDLLKTRRLVMAEVADFINLNKRNEFWSLQTIHSQKILPTLDRVILQLISVYHPTIAAATEDEVRDVILEFIALQLLASCYTLLPATSAENAPLLQQRRGTRVVTALRLHAFHRFCPAAGHHARESSETSSWPGLWSGPSLEDRLAELDCRQRRLEEHTSQTLDRISASNHTIQPMDVSQWTDGPAPERYDARKLFQSRSDSSSTTSSRWGQRWTIEPSTPKDQRHKTHLLFLYYRRKRDQKPENLPRDVSPGCGNPCPLGRLRARTVFKIPVGLRLRRVQSIPHTPVESSSAKQFGPELRRHSSTPMLTGSISYPFEIPETENMLMSTAAKMASQGSHRSCGCERADLVTEDDGYPGSNASGRNSKPQSDYFNRPSSRRPRAGGERQGKKLEQTESGRQGDRGQQKGDEQPEEDGQSEAQSRSSKQFCRVAPGEFDQDAGPGQEESSDDSILDGSKRRGVVGQAVENVTEFAQRLKWREEEVPDVLDDESPLGAEYGA